MPTHPTHPNGFQATRLLTAVPICDGHDSAIMSVNQELVRAGAEVVYLGYHQPADAIARAAVQEDVRAVGLSSYNGGHVVFFQEVATELRQRGRPDLPLFGGGGATITPVDARALRPFGLERIYYAGTTLHAIVADLLKRYGPGARSARCDEPRPPTAGDAALGRWLTLAEERAALERAHQALLARLGEEQRRAGASARLPAADRRALDRLLARLRAYRERLDPVTAGVTRPTVTGVAGPGGVGKSTLIDELVLRFLRAGATSGRLAVLSNDPTLRAEGEGTGALLGDRATMIHSQDDRVFQRSLATRGGVVGEGMLSAAVPDAVRLLGAAGFRHVLVETAGTGQEALPFPPGLADRTVLVLAPDYGARLQLEKLALLRVADVIALNKADRPAAPAAEAELRARLAANGRNQVLFRTVASRHRDAGVDALFAALALGRCTA